MGKPQKNISVVCDWQPPDPLKISKSNKKYSYRWIRKSEVDLRKQQGWEIVERDEVALEHDMRVSRGESTVAECNELVLCKRAKSMNDAHKKYIEDKNKKLLKSLGNQFHQEGQRTGFSTYGSVAVETKKNP